MLNELYKSKIKKIYHAAVSAWWVFLLMAVYVVFAHIFLGTSCLFASTTGLPCPGCGSGRAFVELIRNNFTASFFYYPMLIPSMIVIVIYAVLWFTHDRTPNYTNIMLIGVVIMIIAIYFIRAIIMFPRESPMTYNYKAVLPRLFRLAASLIG